METRFTDAKGRVSLPKAFANATVIIEQMSDTEIRIRKAVVIPEEEISFTESSAKPLSDQDRDRFLEIIDRSPPANDALKRAASRHSGRHV